jgi:sugar (pentulose or hexulose) kinase
MCDQSLDAIGSKGRIIIDGPFAENPVFLAILAAMRPRQQVFASDLRDGTTVGAAVLALMQGNGTLPQIGLNLRAIAPAGIEGLDRYRKDWVARSLGQS